MQYSKAKHILLAFQDIVMYGLNVKFSQCNLEVLPTYDDNIKCVHYNFIFCCFMSKNRLQSYKHQLTFTELKGTCELKCIGLLFSSVYWENEIVEKLKLKYCLIKSTIYFQFRALLKNSAVYVNLYYQQYLITLFKSSVA